MPALWMKRVIVVPLCASNILFIPFLLRALLWKKTPHIVLLGAVLWSSPWPTDLKRRIMTPESERSGKNGCTVPNMNRSSTRKIKNIVPLINQYEPGGPLNHDTIGMLALDSAGNLSGACTTSGMAFKMHGRVGDSPIIGAGLFVDNEIGSATSTGVGEEVISYCGFAPGGRIYAAGISTQRGLP